MSGHDFFGAPETDEASFDESVIPIGPYCYTWIETPSKENNFVGKTSVCPYYKYHNNDIRECEFCGYKGLDLILLDQCKICNTNYRDEE